MKSFFALCIFFAALLGEPYLVEVEPMKQKLLSVLPAAIEDQKTIVDRMKGRTKTLRGMADDASFGEVTRDHYRKELATAEIEHWQSLRVLMLLELMEQDTHEKQMNLQGVA